MSNTSLTGSSSDGTYHIPMSTFTVLGYPHSTGTYNIPMLVLQDITPLHSRGGTYKLTTIDIDAYSRLIPVSAIYRGVVMNLINQAMSTYSNYNFNSMAYYNKKYLGATSTGIYDLEATNDNGSPILAHIKSGPMDFGEKQVKYIRDVWVTHRTDGKLALVFSVDEDSSTEVERITQLVGEELQEEKVKVPRGLTGRYWTIEFKNKDGSDFDLDSLEIMVDILGGKKR